MKSNNIKIKVATPKTLASLAQRILSLKGGTGITLDDIQQHLNEINGISLVVRNIFQVGINGFTKNSFSRKVLLFFKEYANTHIEIEPLPFRLEECSVGEKTENLTLLSVIDSCPIVEKHFWLILCVLTARSDLQEKVLGHDHELKKYTKYTLHAHFRNGKTLGFNIIRKTNFYRIEYYYSTPDGYVSPGIYLYCTDLKKP